MHNYNGDWTVGWVWILYVGFIFLFFSSIGSWSYTYRATAGSTSSSRRTRVIYSTSAMPSARSRASNMVS